MVDKSLFSRLNRLFSSEVVVRNVGGNQLKVIDTNQIQSSGVLQTNRLIDRWQKLYTTSGTSVFNMNNTLNYQTLRVQLYSDYESMDTEAIIASALDIIADECTLKNEFGEVLHIRSSDENIQKILYNLFYDILNIEFNLWTWIRSMCKYGDFYLHLEIAEKFGIYNVIPYSAYNIIREENSDPTNPSYVKFRYDPSGMAGSTSGFQPMSPYNTDQSNNIYFENFEIAHFRLLSDPNFLPYGRSYLEPSRKIFKQLVLMEDAMLIHRIVRAPEKRIFYVNVGAIPPNEVENYMQKLINNQKKTPYVDPQTGQYNLKYNMQNMLEDFYIPVRGNDTTTKIDSAKGLEYSGIDDVNYLKDKLFAALKIPKAFMGYEKDLQGKATLAAEDIRFARTIERIQRIIISELTKIALIHLYSQGYDNENLVNFELSLTTPSIIYDQERVALMKEKVDLAGQIMQNNLLPTDWIYDNIFHFSEDQYDEYRDLIIQDKKRIFRFNQIENEGNDPNESGVTYGTPHDMATLYSGGGIPNEKPEAENTNVPTLGRPIEKSTIYRTQAHPLGKDPLGSKEVHSNDDQEDGSINPTYKGGSPLTLETLAKIQYQKLKGSLPINKKSPPGKKLLSEDK